VLAASIEEHLGSPDFSRFAPDDNPGTMLMRIGLELCWLIVDHPCSDFRREVFRDAMRPSSRSKLLLREFRRAVVDRIAGMLEIWMDAGSVPAGDAHLCATLFFGAIVEEVQFRTYVSNDPPPPGERLALVAGAARIVTCP
jgi:hypothetical protein